ncbi:unnamed protein product [Callosobruchus maculatus]|uniref:Uncharacterized protein n=1 Tax=Callosobruchus maculatus TaxID=64391 RepID=A0A653CXY6_CALMS|nr:unnamed protein product [Callosobruchus maculatus]
MSAHKLSLHWTSYLYVRCFQTAYDKCPMTFFHCMDRALQPRHCVYQVNWMQQLLNYAHLHQILAAPL